IDEEPAARARVPARRVRHFDTDRLAADRFKQQLVVRLGAVAVRIVWSWCSLRTPAADALTGRIDEGDQVALPAAVLRSHNLPQQLNEFVQVALAVLDELLPEIQRTAAGAPPLCHQLDQGIAIQAAFLFFLEERGEKVPHGLGV